MPAFVSRHDQEPGADRKSNEREVGIPETDPVHVVARRPMRQRSNLLVAAEETIEALTDAPLVRARFPVDLIWRKPLRQLRRAGAGLVELGHQPDAPTRQRFARCGGHVVTVT